MLRTTLLLLALPCLVVACAPRGVDVVMHHALEAQRAGDLDGAISRYRRALKVEPRVRGAYNNLAIIALGKGNLTQAVKLLEEELALHPRSSEANRNMAVVLLRLGRADDALARVTPLAAVGGGAPTSRADRRIEQDEARLVLAVARWKAGQDAQAVRQPLELVLSPPPPGLDPALRGELERRARTALTYRALHDGEPGVALPPGAVSGEPPELGVARVIQSLREGKADLALSALEPMGDSPEVRVLRASALLTLARPGEARLALDGLNASTLPSPLAVTFHRLHASLAAAGSDWRGALEHIERAQTAAAGPDSGLTLDRATALAHVGQTEQARALVDSVLRTSPADPRAGVLADALR
ncbi:MAG: tetratricopeptide repeat protein [Myxococcota bacterium]